MKRIIFSRSGVSLRALTAVAISLCFCITYSASLKLTKLPSYNVSHDFITRVVDRPGKKGHSDVYILQGPKLVRYRDGALQTVYQGRVELSCLAVSKDGRFCTVLEDSVIVQKDLLSGKVVRWQMPSMPFNISEDGKRIIVTSQTGAKVIQVDRNKVIPVQGLSLSRGDSLSISGIRSNRIAYGTLHNGQQLKIIEIDLDNGRAKVQKFLGNVLKDTYSKDEYTFSASGHEFSPSGNFAVGLRKTTPSKEQWEVVGVSLRGNKGKYVSQMLPLGRRLYGNLVIDNSGTAYWLTLPFEPCKRLSSCLVLHKANFFEGKGSKVSEIVIQDGLHNEEGFSKLHKLYPTAALKLVKEGLVGYATCAGKNLSFNLAGSKLSVNPVSMGKPIQSICINYEDDARNIAGWYNTMHNDYLDDRAFVYNSIPGTRGNFQDLRQYARGTLGLGKEIQGLQFCKVCKIFGRLQRIVGIAVKGDSQYIFEINK